MEIKEIIEKGIKGGFTNGMSKPNYCELKYHLYEIILKPEFWEAVGKVEGWKEKYKHRIIDEKRPALRCKDCDRKPMVGDGNCYMNIKDEYQEKMHQMIDHLCSGGTIESYIKSL